MRTLSAISVLAICSCGVCASAEPVEVRLTSKGDRPLAVVTAKSAEPRILRAAETLADYLSRISGEAVEATAGDGSKGIAVGLPEHFSGAPEAPWSSDDPTSREDYLLRSHDAGLWCLGASELAVEHAVWDLLYRLGHRQFFPGAVWEVVPRQSDLSIAIDVHERPDFYARRIWYGFGPWDYAEGPYQAWASRNRCASGIELNTGHAYDGIIARNRKAFDAHPEYLALVNGERKSSKLCISNPDLRRLVVEDVLAQFREDPERDSVSVDPSDGPGWCECEECRAMGSVSDRAVTLLNEAAQAANAERPGRLIGMYAYSAHSPPPSVSVHPQGVVSVATAYIRGGYGIDELMAGWNAKGATLGVREYLSVNTWDRDLPGRSRGSDLDYVASSIPRFHAQGARFYSAESSDNWGPNGLGYYLASRILWDTSEAERRDELVDDFLSKAFGEAERPMREFYRLLDGASDPLLSDHLIAGLYRRLQEACAATSDDDVRRRLDDLTLYVRYVELFFYYETAKGEERQAAFEAMIRHVYRMRETMMVHAKALYRDVDRRDKQVTIPETAAWGVPEGKNPWKNGDPFSRAELDRFVAEGIERRREHDIEPVAYVGELRPLPREIAAPAPSGTAGLYSRGERTYWTWIDDADEPLRLTVTAGRVYQDRGDAELALRLPQGDDAEPVDRAAVVPDGEPHEVKLTAKAPGLYRVTVSDGGAGTAVDWPPGQRMAIRSDLEDRADFHGRWSLYFYVPEDASTIAGFASGEGELRNPQGEVVHRFDGKPGYFQIDLDREGRGRFWKFERSSGARLLMTVPPYLARSPEELLLPADAIEEAKPSRRSSN